MKEREITEELREDGVELTIPTLNRIKNGVIKRTGFDIGMGLVRLYERRVQERARKPGPQVSAAHG